MSLALGLAACAPRALVRTDRGALARLTGCVAAHRAQLEPAAKPQSPVSPPECPNARVAALGGEDWLLQDYKMTPAATDSKRGCSRNARPGTAEPIAGDPTLYPYVHLDALPFAAVTGAEDPGAWKLEDIWAFAWDAARPYEALRGARLLAANPPGLRSQDRLHVHVTAISDEARRRLLHPEADADPARRVPPEYVDSLSLPGRPSPVWDAARANAAALARKLGWKGGLETGRFGVAVVYDPERGKFAVAAVAGGPEKQFATLCSAATP